LEEKAAAREELSRGDALRRLVITSAGMQKKIWGRNWAWRRVVEGLGRESLPGAVDDREKVVEIHAGGLCAVSLCRLVVLVVGGW
jgi:hypothetical protein